MIVEDEGKTGEKEVKIKNTGKRNPKRHLELKIDELLNDNIGSLLGRMIATKAFWGLNYHHIKIKNVTQVVHQV